MPAPIKKEAIVVEPVFPSWGEASSYTKEELIQIANAFIAGIEELKARDAQLAVQAEKLEAALSAGAIDGDEADAKLGRIASDREEVARKIETGYANVAAIEANLVLKRL